MTPFDIIVTVITAAGGSAVIVAALAAWLGKVWADRLAQSHKLMQDIDLDLRKRRLIVYVPLWRATAILPRWPKALGVTHDDLQKLSEQLRDWYFQTGGMLLSRSTHQNAYSPLQQTLNEVLQARNSGPINDADYELIRSRCSALRTALAGDIESRREGPH